LNSLLKSATLLTLKRRKVEMKKTITGIFERFFGSYGEIYIQFLKNRFILFRVLLIPALVFIYALTFVVILTVVLIVLVIVLPISMISELKTFIFFGRQ
jgi:hypothetical protein